MHDLLAIANFLLKSVLKVVVRLIVFWAACHAMLLWRDRSGPTRAQNASFGTRVCIWVVGTERCICTFKGFNHLKWTLGAMHMIFNIKYGRRWPSWILYHANSLYCMKIYAQHLVQRCNTRCQFDVLKTCAGCRTWMPFSHQSTTAHQTTSDIGRREDLRCSHCQ